VSEKRFVETVVVMLFVGILAVLIVAVVETTAEVQSLRARVARLEDR